MPRAAKEIITADAIAGFYISCAVATHQERKRSAFNTALVVRPSALGQKAMLLNLPNDHKSSGLRGTEQVLE